MSNDGEAMTLARDWLTTHGRPELVLALDATADIIEVAQHAAETGDWLAAEVLRDLQDRADAWNAGVTP